VTRQTRAKAMRAQAATDAARKPDVTFHKRSPTVKSSWRVGMERPFFFLVAFTSAAILVRSYAASHVGFGDSEALYASYALHPAPAYLDHPGLVGLVMRAIGAGGAPSPEDTHKLTTFATALVPFLIAGAARLAGAKWKRAFWTALIVAVAPEISVGLFAMTPDLILAFTWPLALGLAALALRERPRTFRANGAWALALLLAGIATAAKLSGALLLISLFLTPLTIPSARAHAKTWGPYAGLLLAGMVLWPVVSYEHAFHYALLRHRLVDTASFGPTPKSVAAFLVAQLAYVGPVLLFAAGKAALRLYRSIGRWDAVDDMLAVTTFLPLAALLCFSLVNRVAEPHWIAPALLGLPLFVARESTSEPPSSAPASARPMARRSEGLLPAVAFFTGLFLTALIHVWVLVPACARLIPEDREKLDIANELYGWPRALAVAREMITDERIGTGKTPVVVTPHWVLSAQLAAGLGADVPVACDMPIPTDFDDWEPAVVWRKADSLLFVTDARFPVDLNARFPDRHVTNERTVSVLRGGRIIRTFKLALLGKLALGSR
jgi:hypothetical protein